MAGRFTLEAIFAAKDRLTGPLRRMTSNIGQKVGKWNKVLGEADAVGMRVVGTYKKMGAALGAAGAVVGAAAVNVAKTGAEFEQAITNVGAVSLKSRSEIAELEEKALALGKSTKFTATEVANGMELMAKAGFTSADILSGVEGVLAAAAASGEGLAETSGTVSNVLKGMRMETSEASKVADVLALASSKTNSSIGTLGESMKNLSSVASQFGVSFEDSVAAVALLQDVGLDASVAGSATATMLTKLAKPPANIAKQMKKMGVSFQDAKGDMLPLGDVLANLDKASKKAGGNMKVVALMSDLVGMRGQKAALQLSNMFKSGKVGELSEQLRNAAGAADKMAAIKMDTTTGDMLKLEAAVDGVKTAMFQTQNGPLRGIIQGITKWVEKNGELIASGLAEFLDPVNGKLDSMVTTLERFGRATAVILATAAAIKVATVATGLWNLALNANPLVLWITALAGFAALVAAFWPEISAFLSDVWDGIKNIGDTIAEVFGALRDLVVDFIPTVASFGGDFVSGLASIVGLGDDDEDAAGGATSAGATRESATATATPQEAVTRSFSESVNKTRAEVVVSAESGSQARIAKQPAGGNVRLQPSGSF